MREPVVSEFLRLVEIDSPSRQERDLADYLHKRCAELGIKLTEDDTAAQIGGTAGNLLGFLPGDDREPLLLCAHMDTVRSNKGINVVTTDGKLLSEGGQVILGADDKAGIAAILDLVRRFQQDRINHPPIEILFSFAEETGLWGAKLIDLSKLRSKQGYVLDAGGPIGTVVRRSPEHHEFKIKIHGRAAHAGNQPEQGINAIQMASKIVAAIRLGRIDEYTTANIGKISGGEADNIVPDYAELSGETRSYDPERIRHYLAQLTETVERVSAEYGGRGEVVSAESYPAMELDLQSPAAKSAEASAKKLGLPYELVNKGGGSDANILNNRGFTCANLGMGAYREHCGEEYITIDDLKLLVSYLGAICEVW